MDSWTLLRLLLAAILHVAVCSLETPSEYRVDDAMGYGRNYDGIGGLSGGSATSKLLIAYPEKQRNEILDYLFKPNFAASLQILKVEIGGDAQSSDATEASHMHNSWEENYNRGYEWWLMKEAKKRNPDIKLYGLPWNFPGWLGKGTQNPFIDPQLLATYIMKWVRGAKQVHGLDIDYIGIWNERSYSVPYIKALRTTLDSEGFSNVRILAADDGGWEIADHVMKDPSLYSFVDFLGSHYPGTWSTSSALASGKPLWSSEDYSSYNNDEGGGCWARILNQNYVNGFMTSTIAWNLIDSFYRDLPWDRDSLMTAREPWSGFYIVESPIWVSAHTTQFTEVGWLYLQHGKGVGLLDQGGSYVSLTSPDAEHLTIVIETMSHDHSACIRPPLPPYSVSPQTVVFNLGGSFANIGELQVWYTRLGFDNSSSVLMEKYGTVKPKNGEFTLKLGVDELWTLTTLTTGQKGEYPPPPPSQNFTLPYEENFEEYEEAAEPYLLAQQQGAYEVADSGDDSHGKVMRQMVLQMPVVWCSQTALLNATINLLGQVNWTEIFIQADVSVGPVNGTTGVFIAGRIDQGGCETYQAKGVYFFLFPNDNLYLLTSDIQRSNILAGGREYTGIVKGWNTMSLLIQNGRAVGVVNSKQLFNVSLPANPPNGFVGVGTDSYGLADFDNIKVTSASQGQEILARSRTKIAHGDQDLPLFKLTSGQLHRGDKWATVKDPNRKYAAPERKHQDRKQKVDNNLYFKPHRG